MSIVEKITPYWIQTISFLAQWTAAVIDDRPDLVILLAIVAIILVLVIAAIKIIRRYLTPPPTPGKTPLGSFIAGRDLEAIRSNLQQLADAENATSNRISAFGEALIPAVKEIGLRLDKLQDKDRELTQHAEATDRFLRDVYAAMKASSEVAVHVEGLRSQLASALSEFAEFREKTEADTLQQNQKYAESIAVVEQKLASIDRRIENLSNAINLQALELDEVSSELRSGHS